VPLLLTEVQPCLRVKSGIVTTDPLRESLGVIFCPEAPVEYLGKQRERQSKAGGMPFEIINSLAVALKT